MERILLYLAMGVLGLLLWFKELFAHIFLLHLSTDEILSLFLILLLGQCIAMELHHIFFRRESLNDKERIISELSKQRDYWSALAQATTDSSIKYFPPSNQIFNEPFYNHFFGVLEAAKHSIYLVGMGFSSEEYASVRGRAIIARYNDAIRRALQNDVTIFRLQCRGNISTEWAHDLKSLMQDFPSKLKIFYCPDDETNVVVFTSIDPDLAEDCVVEILISSNHLWVGPKRPASADFTAMFIKNNVKLAESCQKQAIQIMQKSVHLTSPDMVDEILLPQGRPLQRPRGRRGGSTGRSGS